MAAKAWGFRLYPNTIARFQADREESGLSADRFVNALLDVYEGSNGMRSNNGQGVSAQE